MRECDDARPTLDKHRPGQHRRCHNPAGGGPSTPRPLSRPSSTIVLASLSPIHHHGCGPSPSPALRSTQYLPAGPKGPAAPATPGLCQLARYIMAPAAAILPFPLRLVTSGQLFDGPQQVITDHRHLNTNHSSPARSRLDRPGLYLHDPLPDDADDRSRRQRQRVATISSTRRRSAVQVKDIFFRSVHVLRGLLRQIDDPAIRLQPPVSSS